ncbi:MAG TPA: DUF5668 domain-containing protein [Candidatus Saccharibacteria bacterium]|nr:DUF5668 domain-containing protein [Candidatus Saccharibacteria bacterium]
MNEKNDSSKKANNNDYHKQELNIEKDWNLSKIFWGLLFIIIGLLAFLNNLNLVDVNWNNTWRLWPLIIISIGVSILSIKNIVWKIASIVIVISMLGSVIWVMIGDYPSCNKINQYNSTTKLISKDITSAKISIKAGAVSLLVDSSDQDNLINSSFESNYAIVSQNSIISNHTQIVDLTMSSKKSSNWFLNDYNNKWTVGLNNKIPLKLSVDAGASDISIDASGISLESADIKVGVSKLLLKIGEKVSKVDIKINSGVSSILVSVPKESGIKLNLEDGMASKNIADMIEIDDNIYESSDYDVSKNKIDISAKIGISSITVERY